MVWSFCAWMSIIGACVSRTAVSNRSRNSPEHSQELAAAAKVTAAPNGAVAFCCKERQLASERVPRHRDAVRINTGHRFQEGQSREDIVELLSNQHCVLQSLAGLSTLGTLLAHQEILHEGPLVCRQALAPTEGIKENVAVFDKNGHTRVSRLPP